MSVILGFLTPLLQIGATIFGNIILAKWITALRMWWESQTFPELKAEVEKQYQALNSQATGAINARPSS